MASIFKPTYTRTDPKTGKKTKRRLKKWYVKYRDADNIIRKVPGYTDKTATQQLAAQLEREAELEKVGITDPFEKHRKRPLAEHIDDYRNNLLDKENTDKHVDLVIDRVRCIVDWGKFKFVDDVSPSKVEAFLGDLRKRGRSIQTSNHYLSAMKGFCRWMVMDRRLGDNPVAHLKKLNVRTDRRHDRRALAPSEFAALIDSAISGPPVESVSGADRAMLYVLAAWTGYRRSELASLTLRSFNLDACPPTVSVQAGYSKRRRTDSIPLHSAVVERLREWLEGKVDVDPDEPLLPIRTRGGNFRKTAKMMQRDLERIGIAYRDEDGLYADFHANRHTFISNLGKAGVSAKEAQTLARHSDINLTMNVYTHVGLNDQASAVEGLPAPPRFDRSGSEQLRATGTEGAHGPKHVPTPDPTCRNLASSGHETRREGDTTLSREPGVRGPSDADCRPMTTDGKDSAAVGRKGRSLPTEPKVRGSNPLGCTQPLLDDDLDHSRCPPFAAFAPPDSP